uniref:Dynein heavy chain 7, axonemal n=1 Tax=Caenorhabditis tropicalis TaxID=1561998 RepID=A0A1I7TTZ6_9PELO
MSERSVVSNSIQAYVLHEQERLFAVPKQQKPKKVKTSKARDSEYLPETLDERQWLEDDLLKFPINLTRKSFFLPVDPVSELDIFRRRMDYLMKRTILLENKVVFFGNREMTTKEWDREDLKMLTLLKKHDNVLQTSCEEYEKLTRKLDNEIRINPFRTPTVEPIKLRGKEKIARELMENTASNACVTDYIRLHFSFMELSSFRNKMCMLSSLPISIIAESLHEVEEDEIPTKEEMFNQILDVVMSRRTVLKDLHSHWPETLLKRGRPFLEMLIFDSSNRKLIKNHMYSYFTYREYHDFARRVYLLAEHLTNFVTAFRLGQIMSDLFPRETHEPFLPDYIIPHDVTKTKPINYSDLLELTKAKLTGCRYLCSYLFEEEVSEVLTVEQKHFVATLVLRCPQKQSRYYQITQQFLKDFLHLYEGLREQMLRRGLKYSKEEITLKLEADFFVLRLFYATTQNTRFNFADPLSRQQYNEEFKCMFANQKYIMENRDSWTVKGSDLIDEEKVMNFIQSNMKTKKMNNKHTVGEKVREYLAVERNRREELVLESMKFESEQENPVTPLGDHTPEYPKASSWPTLLKNARDALESTETVQAGPYVFRFHQRTNQPTFPWDVVQTTWIDYQQESTKSQKDLRRKMKKPNFKISDIHKFLHRMGL